MMIKDLHLTILELMEFVRSKIEFWYGTRERNAPGTSRARDGYAFLGNEKYIWVPICPHVCSANKTRSVGIVFEVENKKKIVESWLEVLIPKGPNADPYLAAVLMQLVGHRKRSDCSTAEYDRYQMIIQRRGVSAEVVLDQTKYFLIANLPLILQTLNGFGMRKDERFVYTPDLMKKSLLKLKKLRAGMSEDLDERLSAILKTL